MIYWFPLVILPLHSQVFYLVERWAVKIPPKRDLITRHIMEETHRFVWIHLDAVLVDNLLEDLCFLDKKSSFPSAR